MGRIPEDHLEYAHVLEDCRTCGRIPEIEVNRSVRISARISLVARESVSSEPFPKSGQVGLCYSADTLHYRPEHDRPAPRRLSPR